MSDAYFDEYDHYNFDDKLVHSRGSGKNRSKQEAEQNKHHNDTDGHTRASMKVMVVITRLGGPREEVASAVGCHAARPPWRAFVDRIVDAEPKLKVTDNGFGTPLGCMGHHYAEEDLKHTKT
ncbi:putative DNA-binding nuclear phosphoprotein p8-containing protein [Homarus americanus]|uniref:Putative DNA-binding nuclear phosphoprotein p8-containing protein n=1 Tax=Homarus americanus TaxID=6706 RepID=A0A8J5MN64_HOMAM|nr:putative DNA-binding nuclear phosphoprotein p8-containing protein [Homarus americanus]